MAQTEHVPVYRAAYDLCLNFEQVVRNFSRYHKLALSGEGSERVEGFGLGTDLRDGPVRCCG